MLCELETGERFIARQPFDAPRPEPDEPVYLSLSDKPGVLHLFDVETGGRMEAAR